MAPMSGSLKRNIIFCGETGMGKSSAINLLLQANTVNVSNDSQPCTQDTACYPATLNGMDCNLWDTRGVGEARNLFQVIFKRSSEKELKKFLKERHKNNEIDLLVYCVRGSRATSASVKYYNAFCATTRQLVAPVVLALTHLEKEENMDDWWDRNSSELNKLKMEFDDHVCITTLPNHSRSAESKQRLVNMITKDHHWEVKAPGHYFGNLVSKPRPTPSVPSRKGGVSGLYKAQLSDRVRSLGRVRHPSNHSSTSATAPSPRNSSYHTAESPRESVPPSPTVEPPTPRVMTVPAKLPQINTALLSTGNPSQSAGEDTSSMGSSMFSTSLRSSHTSYSEMPLQSCTEENEDYFSELPFRLSASTVRRRTDYATRRGAFGDIWECDLISGESSHIVAVKAVKTDTNDLGSHEKKLRRELKVWGKLQHRNVVPLLGVVSGFGPLPSMVSPWFRNGSLSQYLARHQTLSLSDKHRLLRDIAAGLRYLHSEGVIHGDLHSDNVLINEHGTACLTDFGLSLVKDFVGTSYLKSSICGGVQFADPALVQRVDSSRDVVCYPTKPCDVYSFGGLVLHVLSGKKPYEGIHTTTIFLTVWKGERPQLPTSHKHITQWHKSTIRACWDREESRRPLADDLVRMFERGGSWRYV